MSRARLEPSSLSSPEALVIAADEVRAEVRAWILEHAIDGVIRRGAHPAYDHEATEVEEEWLGRCREGRWLCLSWPEEYGGRAFGPLQIAAVEEEFARAGLPRPRLGMGETLVAPALLAHGSDTQRSYFLPRILNGEIQLCQGFSEPDAGSDLAGLRTVGVIDGDEVIITGQKVWTSDAHRSNTIFTLCRTDPSAPRHRGISYVLVPMDHNGITVRPLRQMAGAHGFNHVFFDGARAPLSNVVGGLNNGWRVAQTTLGAERAGEATTQHIGYLQEWEMLLAASRRNGSNLDPVLRQGLASAYAAVRIMQFTGLRMFSTLTATGTLGPVASVNKLFWSEYHRDFGELAMHVLGTRSTLVDRSDDAVTELQRVFLESRARCIARGSSEIQRNIVAERVLGLPREQSTST